DQDYKIGPRDRAAILLLDRPKQSPGLVEADVVGPAIEGGKADSAGAGAAPAVVDAISAGAVPGQANHERPVMAIVGGPPLLRRRQHLGDVLLQGIEI